MDVSGQGGSVYNETVYRPKDHKERSQKRRKMLVGIVVVLLVILLIIIIAVAVAKGEKPNQALRFYPEVKDNIIKFNKNDTSTYNVYTAALINLIDEYKIAGAKTNCSAGSSVAACAVNLAELEKLSPEFGYNNSKPVVILQLKPDAGWKPTFYPNTSTSLPSGVSQSSPDHIPVTCSGKDSADEDNIGDLRMTPTFGFVAKYFPYSEETSSMAPLVAVQFMNLSQGVAVAVVCRAHDPAIARADLRLFETSFYVQIDT